jgi:hypothetical protein
MIRLQLPKWQEEGQTPRRYHLRDITDTRHLALLGDVGSQYNLGVMYVVNERHSAAAYWFRQAALRGHPQAEYNLAVMYLNGTLPRDVERAAALLQRSADGGFADAQFQLGRMHYAGEGVPRDPKAEARWYRAAAEQGHALAQYNLGVVLHLGEGVPADDVAAWAWFATADANGLDSRDALAVIGATLDADRRHAAEALADEYRSTYAR